MKVSRIRRFVFGHHAWLALLLSLPLLDVAAAAQPASAAKLDKALTRAAARAAASMQRVMIATTDDGTAVRSHLLAKGRRLHAGGELPNLVTADVSAADLAELTARADVRRVSTDAVVKANAQSDTTVVPHLLGTLGLASGRWTGTGVGVAVIDSGLANLAAFGNARDVWDFTLTGKHGKALPPRKVTPADGYGHGTAIASLIANRDGFSSSAYRGVATGVTLHPMRVLDATGAGYTSNVVRAVDFAIANRAAFGIDIINLSLGHPILEAAATDPLVQAVERAVQAGIVVVISAGNLGRNPQTGTVGYAGITSPGNAPSAITVGALDTQQTDARGDDVVPDYSSRGPTYFDGLAKPDLVAPGTRLPSVIDLSSLLSQYTQFQLSGSVVTAKKVKGVSTAYMRFSGTSMAAAVTTAVVAQMI